MDGKSANGGLGRTIPQHMKLTARFVNITVAPGVDPYFNPDGDEPNPWEHTSAYPTDPRESRGPLFDTIDDAPFTGRFYEDFPGTGMQHAMDDNPVRPTWFDLSGRQKKS